jgi:hypothetical protein
MAILPGGKIPLLSFCSAKRGVEVFNTRTLRRPEVGGYSYQMLTRLSAGRTIGQLSGRLNALANSGMLDIGALHR